MLRVTVELVPYGDETKKKKIGEMVLANTGDGTGEKGDYEAWTAPDNWSGEPAKYGKLFGYDRSQSVWELVYQMVRMVRLADEEPTSELSSRLKERLGG